MRLSACREVSNIGSTAISHCKRRQAMWSSGRQEAVLGGIFQVIVLGTGHAAMWAATLGRWKPTNSRDSLAAIVGILLWVVLFASMGLALRC